MCWWVLDILTYGLVAMSQTFVSAVLFSRPPTGPPSVGTVDPLEYFSRDPSVGEYNRDENESRVFSAPSLAYE